MQIFNSGLFWFIEGIFVCLVIVGFNAWMKDKAIPMPFWKWIAFGIWLVLFGFTIAFIGTSAGENEMTAALLGGIVFGVITIITGVIVWRLIRIGSGEKNM